MSVGTIIASTFWPTQGSELGIKQFVSAPKPKQLETLPEQQTTARSTAGPAEHGEFRAQLAAPAPGSIASTQQQKIDALIEPLQQANAVFAKLPRPSPLRDVQLAFEKRFPGEPRPVALSSLDLQAEPPQGVASPSFMNARDIQHFISQLPSNQPGNIARQQAQDFATPGEDGRTPRELLAEIRQHQIGLEASLQDDRQTLGKEGKALVEAIRTHPSTTDLERAYPDESKRPKLYSLSVRSENEATPALTLQGPFVMVQPRTASPATGKTSGDLFVLYLPRLGLKEFNSKEDLMASIAISPGLGKCLPEWVQSRLPETTRYAFDTLEPIPADLSVFEHSIQQQIDKQEHDTRYRLERAEKRGVSLAEFDAIANHSTRDLRRSFEPPRFISHPPRQLDVRTLLAKPLRA